MNQRAPRPAAWLALSLLGAAAPTPAATSPLPARPTQYATDLARVFPPPRLAQLNERLAAFERATSNQVLVYVDRSLPPGTTLEELGATAIREWGVGQKDKANGVILFIFTQDRAFRLEVGYGLEGALPDARARQITSDIVRPFFKRGDYAGGIEAGVEAILAAAGGEGFQGKGRTHAESARLEPYRPVLPPLLALGLTLLLGLVLRKSPGRSPRFYIFLPLLTFSLSLFGDAIVRGHILWALGGIALFLVSIVILGILGILGLARLPRGQADSSPSSPPTSATWEPASSTSSFSSSSDSFSSDSSSSSSSDFSGGGGSGGGGGSSDSW